jgi:rSAM/selenodomain-associated transferase 1
MRQLGIFAKFWAPGEVKTRLAASIGPEQGARLHRVFLETLIKRLSLVADRRVLVYSPPTRRLEFGELAAAGWELQPQADGDLGQRMQVYFQLAFASGATQAVLIGSDSPTLPITLIELAFKRLDETQAVLGPAADGGYYLVGATGAVPPIFDRIAWSRSSVWAETVARLEAARWTFSALPDWYDVDDWDDLQRLRAELDQPDRSGSDFAMLRRAVAAACEARRFPAPPQ